MKYGFSKGQLKHVLENVGINYVHVPELGINSDKRKKLDTKEDYEKLFTDYEKTVLPGNSEAINRLYSYFNQYKRIALTCFEADPYCCHRSRTAAALKSIIGSECKLINI